MKKRLTRIYFIFILLTPMLVCGQKKTFLSLGGEVVFPAASYMEIGSPGWGGSLNFEHAGPKHLSSIITLKYISFSTKQVNQGLTQKLSVLPVQFGVKYYTKQITGNPAGWYFTGQLGFTIEFNTAKMESNTFHATYNETNVGFCGSVGMGYQLGILDLGFRFQNFLSSNSGATFYYTFRVAVRIL